MLIKAVKTFVKNWLIYSKQPHQDMTLNREEQDRLCVLISTEACANAVDWAKKGANCPDPRRRPNICFPIFVSPKEWSAKNQSKCRDFVIRKLRTAKFRSKKGGIFSAHRDYANFIHFVCFFAERSSLLVFKSVLPNFPCRNCFRLIYKFDE